MISEQEIATIGQILAEILQNDNTLRKAAEEKLNAAKRADPDRYACYLVSVLSPECQFGIDVKSLAAVILRRNISIQATDYSDLTENANNANLYQRLTDQAREYVQNAILTTLQSLGEGDRQYRHKVCNLAVEVQGAMYEHTDNNIWQNLLNLIFQFTQQQQAFKIEMALNIFNGLFSYILDHMMKFKAELSGIFAQTLSNPSLEIKLAALQATSNFLQMADRKDVKAFLPLLPQMVQVVTDALKADDETVLEDALVEFNELAEMEPAFFKPNFKDIYEHLKPIIAYTDFANSSIRHQPLEFVVTILERKPSIAKQDIALLKDILEQIFKLMIDIDEDIDQAWMRPKEGFALGNDEEEEDSVQFGQTCVDRLLSGIGDTVMLPLIGQLVQNTIANESDWRYKNAGILAFSQVGEYVDEPSKIATMIPVIIQHMQHPNPKIRHAALHCVGQIADDMPEEFQKAFHADLVPPMIATLDDPVPRVVSHACAAMTNFFENAHEEQVLPYMQTISQKLCNLIKDGISIVKENAVSALATVAEKAGENFIPFFKDTIYFLIGYLNTFLTPEYKQFRGQVIEAITIICAGCEPAFAPVAHDVIQVLLTIQNTQLEKRDAQRVYLLSAWQRICLLMKADFAPYLKDVLPGIFSSATLNPQMGVAGQDALASLTDVLSEIKPETASGAKEEKMNVVTDEIDEKDVAIQMLAVFIDEVGEAFIDWVDQTAQVLLSLTDFDANDSIRASSAECLPGLVRVVKKVHGINANLHNMGRTFTANLHKAMQKETETDSLIAQVNAFKDIIDECGQGFLTAEEVSDLGQKAVRIVTKSLERVAENNEADKNWAAEKEDDDEDFDDEDYAMIKEENNNEFDLQFAAAELMGILFKTHREFVGELVGTLQTSMLPAAFASDNQKRKKFGIFVLDDMVEHLGPSFFTQEQFGQIVQIICSFSSDKSAALRQASGYGIGIIAQNSGDAFQIYADICLNSLKHAVEYAMSPKVEEKKLKQTQYHHARDNAIASIGKIIKYQTGYVMSSPQLAQDLVAYWLGLLPFHHDEAEAQQNFEFIADFLESNPAFIFGADPANTAVKLAKIFSESYQEKFWDDSTNQKKKMAWAIQYCVNSAPSPVPETFKQTCQNVLSNESQQRIQAALTLQI